MPDPNRLKELTFGVTSLLDPPFRNGTGTVMLDDYVLDFPREINLGPIHAVLDETTRRFERRAVASPGVLGIRFHDMRHTHATLLL